jgi:hypothetical protein
MLKPIIEGKIKSLEVTDAATDNYNKWIEERMTSRVWQDCESWYRLNKVGRNIAIFPGPMALFWWKLRQPRWDHFISVGRERWAKEKGSPVVVMKWALLLLGVSVFMINMITVSQ